MIVRNNGISDGIHALTTPMLVSRHPHRMAGAIDPVNAEHKHHKDNGYQPTSLKETYMLDPEAGYLGREQGASRWRRRH